MPINVCFIPYYEDNPYQRELARALRAHGVVVTPRRGYKWLAALLLGRKEKPDIVHLHWLPPLRRDLVGGLRFVMFFMRALYLRAFGCRIVWTVHNLHDHDASWPRIEMSFARLVVALSSRVIVHSPTAEEIVTAEVGANARPKMVVVPHGNYIGVYPDFVSRAEARERLDLNPRTTVFLFLGYLRPYKGLNELIHAFRRLNESDCVLMIAGSPFNAGAVDELRAEIGGDSRVRLRPGYVAEKDIQLYIKASDAVVFPYQAVLTSGAVLLAMSFGRACVAPRIGCIPDVLSDEGAVLYDRADPDGLRAALSRVVHERERLPDMGAHNLATAKQWDWGMVADTTAEAYATIVGRNPSAQN